MRNVIVTIAAAVLFTGCATFNRIAPPEVGLVDVEFTELNLFETTGVFSVRLSNENPFPIAVDGAVYEIWLNGIRIGKALSNEAVEVPRLGDVRQNVTVHFRNLPLVLRAWDAVQRQEIDYRVRTTLYAGSDGASHRLRQDNRGSLRLSDAQSRSLQSFLTAPAPADLRTQ